MTLTMERAPASAGPVAATHRLQAVDIVRGAIMILMAIDHVRVYAGVPAGGPTPAVFFTRWITHFCAPGFVFLAGTSAYLYGRRLESLRAGGGGTTARAELARYLLTRGLLLIVLEFTVIRASWTFSFDYSQFLLAGVIWVLGWCMVLMAALVHLPVRVIGAIGLGLVFGQTLVGLLATAGPVFPSTFWQFLYLNGEVQLGSKGPVISVLYTVVPWIGVMAAGYAFGTVLVRDDAGRQRLCHRIGLVTTGAFVVIAALSVAVGPAPDDAPPALIRALNQNKYPASPLFLMMTLGPLIALLPLAERARGPIAAFLSTFGRVPMFYYLLHIPAIHAAALAVNVIRGAGIHPEWYATAPYSSVPPEYRWSLPLLYLVFAIVVAALYVPCRWYAGVKQRRSYGWMRFL